LWWLMALVFLTGAGLSLLASWVLVQRLERLGERIGLSEVLLGLAVALTADAPEITAAVTAIAQRQQHLGAGVVIGSNVFNLAALLGLAAVIAGRIGLHRKVVALGGTVAMVVALSCLAVVAGLVPPAAGLALALFAFAIYAVILSGTSLLARVRLPAAWTTWLRAAVMEEEAELGEALKTRPARWPDAVTAVAALAVVVGASIAMEQAAARLGGAFGVAPIVTGGLVLAAITSLPNAVAAIYLAARGRGAATLSTALNSNALNVIAGFLLPAAIAGLARPSGQVAQTAAWYVGLSLLTLVLAWRLRGLGRRAGALIITAYLAFAWSLVASASGIPIALQLGVAAGLLLSGPFLPAAVARLADLSRAPSRNELPGRRCRW